jgi:hypothetical protein
VDVFAAKLAKVLHAWLLRVAAKKILVANKTPQRHGHNSKYHISRALNKPHYLGITTVSRFAKPIAISRPTLCIVREAEYTTLDTVAVEFD